MNLDLQDENLELLPERGLWWEARQTLIVADPHFGKAATFRRFGIPVPEATTHATLDQLTAMLRRTNAKRLLVLGDLMHDVDGHHEVVSGSLQRWRENFSTLAILNLTGNHDRKAGPMDALWRIEAKDVFYEPPFVFRHEPEPDPRGYVLAGHLHPAITLTGMRGRRTKWPCFHFGKHVGVLPAVGQFTGTHTIRREGDDRVFAVGPDAMIEVPRARSSTVRRHATITA